MGVLDILRARAARRPIHMIARIVDEPQFRSHSGAPYMIFHLEEVPGREFHLKMLPTTPKRRRGERVELSYQEAADGIAWVESLSAAPDAEATRRRNQEYLANIEASKPNHG